MLQVTANHVDPRWRLDRQRFLVVDAGDTGDRNYRVGGEHANGFYAIAPNFGCGRTSPTPERAIRSLLESNGCTGIVIDLIEG